MFMIEYGSLRVPKQTFDLIKKLAAEERRTMTVLVARMATEYCEKYQAQNTKKPQEQSLSG
jgi:hypothetical protein